MAIPYREQLEKKKIYSQYSVPVHSLLLLGARLTSLSQSTGMLSAVDQPGIVNSKPKTSLWKRRKASRLASSIRVHKGYWFRSVSSFGFLKVFSHIPFMRTTSIIDNSCPEIIRYLLALLICPSFKDNINLIWQA